MTVTTCLEVQSTVFLLSRILTGKSLSQWGVAEVMPWSFLDKVIKGHEIATFLSQEHALGGLYLFVSQ